MQITPQNYKKLLTKIQKTITKTKQNIVKSVNRQKVEMSWEIGKEIDLHLKENKSSGYGEDLFNKLASDTSIEKSSLYKMRAFYKTYPKLPSEEKALSWSHYRNLIAVKDEETRQKLEGLVIENGLASDKLQQAIGKTKKVTKKSPKNNSKIIPQLRVKRGQLFTYKLTKEGEADLGFNVFLTNPSSATSSQSSSLGLGPEDLSSSASKDPRAKSPRMTAGEVSRMTAGVGKVTTEERMVAAVKRDYIYKAELERVVDGDTIHVKLDLGFGIKHREILRLTKINAPEMKTPEGKKSSDALKKILKDVKFLIVKTNKTDIYGRYVADVFFDETGKESDAQKVAESGTYLSQLILDKGLAELF